MAANWVGQFEHKFPNNRANSRFETERPQDRVIMASEQDNEKKLQKKTTPNVSLCNKSTLYTKSALCTKSAMYNTMTEKTDKFPVMLMHLSCIVYHFRNNRFIIIISQVRFSKAEELTLFPPPPLKHNSTIWNTTKSFQAEHF